MHGTMNGHSFSPRLMTVDDIEWALSVARMHYQGRYDENAVRAWLKERLPSPHMVFLRTDHAIGIAHLAMRFHMPSRPQAYLTLLYAEPGNHGREVLRIVQGLRDWATGKNAGKLFFGDFTGHDMAAIARILGGRLAGHTYVFDLDGDAQILG